MFLGVPAERVFVRCQATQNAIIRETYLQARAAERGAGHTPTFGYVGRLSAEKNVDLLIRAYQRTFADVPPSWRLHIIGSGPLEASLRALAGTTPHLPIEFVGGVSWREIPKLMTHIDVVILPSSSEPWGLVVNEAMLCEKAVIVSNACGCVPELVHHGRNGLVFEPINERELADAMMKFVANPELADEMGQEGLNIVSSYTPHAAASQMLAGMAYVSGLPLPMSTEAAPAFDRTARND
jgi:glycosyltransferase involved in cell wall biosynthesis